jgi:hypothetical protein
MATKILLKKSVTGGASPLTADLDQGELAINLVDRKIYTKDNANNITEITGAYVDSVAPTNPVEGDVWYDTVANQLKAYDGSAFQAAGYQTVSALEDVTLTSIASGDHLTWNGSAFVNSNFEADVEGLLTATNTGTGHGELTYANGVYTFDKVTSAEVRADISVTDVSGDGSLSYDNGTGVITYTGPSAAEVRAHHTAGTGVTITSGEIAIGQPVATTDDVTFNDVIVDGNLTVNGTTTAVNSNEVNIGDSVILLNSDETGAASVNAGFEVERGTDANVSFVWNETDDKWDLNNEELQNVVIDGGSY